MQKEYKKVTAIQFRDFINKVPIFQEMALKLQDEMQSVSKEKWDSLLTSNYSWAWVYELPLAVHMAVVLRALNLSDWLQEAVNSADPQQRVLDDLDAAPNDEFHPDVEEQIGIGLVISNIRTMQSIALFGRSLSALIHEARETGNPECLFKAIKVDRTVVNCATAADFIAKAELRNDKAFFRALSNAYKGPSKKEWAGLAAMKISFHLLREMELDDLSDDELEQLMVHVLDVYKDVPGARKNLRMHYQNFRQFQTI
jgi:hypothetical protein